MKNLEENIIGIQEWFENSDGEWSGLGWETEDGDEIDESEYEIGEIIDTDKHVHPTKAYFKKII